MVSTVSVNRNIASKARHLAEKTSPPPGGHPLKRCSDYGPVQFTQLNPFLINLKAVEELEQSKKELEAKVLTLHEDDNMAKQKIRVITTKVENLSQNMHNVEAELSKVGKGRG